MNNVSITLLRSISFASSNWILPVNILLKIATSTKLALPFLLESFTVRLAMMRLPNLWR